MLFFSLSAASSNLVEVLDECSQYPGQDPGGRCLATAQELAVATPSVDALRVFGRLLATDPTFGMSSLVGSETVIAGVRHHAPANRGLAVTSALNTLDQELKNRSPLGAKWLAIDVIDILVENLSLAIPPSERAHAIITLQGLADRIAAPDSWEASISKAAWEALMKVRHLAATPTVPTEPSSDTPAAPPLNVKRPVVSVRVPKLAIAVGVGAAFVFGCVVVLAAMERREAPVY